MLVNFCQDMSEFNWYAFGKLIQDTISVDSATIWVTFYGEMYKIGFIPCTEVNTVKAITIL